MSLNYLATRFTCSWPFNTAVLLCDGRIVCGCADPYAKRVLGDTRTSSVSDVWRGETATRLREDLNKGGSTFCGDCPLKLPLADTDTPPQRSLEVGGLPRRMYIETTAACNISCFQSCCAPETGITKTRQAGMLDFEVFRKVIDEAAPHLARIDFFNYGEAFLHKRAVEMCEYIKTHYPHVYLYTSTNGLAFTEDAVRRLLRSGIDEVTFSIDGSSAETYIRYRQRGDFAKAIRNLGFATDEKRRGGLELPVINWRYILFNWNDSEAEMRRARKMAGDLGVDRLCWEITDHPEEAFSRRFVPGSSEHADIRHEIWDNNNLGNAIPGCTPRARIELRGFDPDGGASESARRAESLVALRGGDGSEPLRAWAGGTLAVQARVRNLTRRPFAAQGSHGRRLVRLGAQLAKSDGTMLDQNYARAWLPHSIAGGERADVMMTVPVPSQPGNYLLRFDLVSEGIDWFEACGSEPTVRPLYVR
jgi:MoaA/NifB/PqqE/SkfB family radical SAM enzyme